MLELLNIVMILKHFVTSEKMLAVYSTNRPVWPLLPSTEGWRHIVTIVALNSGRGNYQIKNPKVWQEKSELFSHF